MARTFAEIEYAHILRDHDIPEGYYLYREEYPFGRCWSFRLPDQVFENHIFIYQNKRLTWAELKRDLRENWCPQSQDNITWKEQYINR